MKWMLISFSEMVVPVEPFKEKYIIGVIQNENLERMIVQIDDKFHLSLKIGMYGNLSKEQKNSREINYFNPT
ncbi:hypothetical protein [Methanolacinia petrolearia]|uniref:hypothetical protein n=1 Tax=Methanolacinia petrolearia TaxID=54120 RepID=UPI003BAB7935